VFLEPDSILLPTEKNVDEAVERRVDMQTTRVQSVGFELVPGVHTYKV
jgi:hypothetical protein